MAILRSRPPLLHAVELDVPLIFRFSLWSSGSIEIFYERLPEEALERGNYNISELLTSQLLPPTASRFLIEDIELGICSTLLDIWQSFQGHRDGTPTASVELPPPTTLISSRIGIWKTRLCGLASLMEQQGTHVDMAGTDFLLRAYLGKESPDEPGWEEVVASRIGDLVSDATLLHKLLDVVLLGENHDLWDSLAELASCQFSMPLWLRLFASARDHHARKMQSK